jgi:hypothetical protein
MDRLVFGMGGCYKVPTKILLSLLDHAYEHGIRIFDTADLYGSGYSSYWLSYWLKSRGINDILVINKTGLCYTINIRTKYRYVSLMLVLLAKLGILNFKLCAAIKTKFGDNRTLHLAHENIEILAEMDGFAGFNIPNNLLRRSNYFIQGSAEEDLSMHYDSIFGLMRKCRFNMSTFCEAYYSTKQYVLYTTTSVNHLDELCQNLKKRK